MLLTPLKVDHLRNWYQTRDEKLLAHNEVVKCTARIQYHQSTAENMLLRETRLEQFQLQRRQVLLARCTSFLICRLLRWCACCRGPELADALLCFVPRVNILLWCPSSGDPQPIVTPCIVNGNGGRYWDHNTKGHSSKYIDLFLFQP